MNNVTDSNANLAQRGFEILQHKDPDLYFMLEEENTRQNEVLSMVASSSVCNPSVLACEGSVLTNVTTEGYPGGIMLAAESLIRSNH